MTGDRSALLADIGGTNARFALSTGQGIEQEQVLACAGFASLEEAARAYLQSTGARPATGAFAVASPITGDTVRMTNLPWAFSIEAVRRSLGLERLDVINDFTAVALSIPHLAPADLVQIGSGTARAGLPIGIIGPGSGLGVSALVPGPRGWMALASEGGHVTLPAVTDREAAVIARLRADHGHVSAERLVSGPGLVALYETLAALDRETPATACEAAAISKAALAGGDPLARQALSMFCALLGTLAGNLALTLGALGGVYIAGGIVPRFVDFLAASEFRHRFTAKGRMSTYLEPVPTFVVTHKLPALVGLRARLAEQG